MFEARMNEQADRPWGFEGTSNREAGYYRRGYTAALNDLQGKVDGLVDALELCASDVFERSFYVENARKALAEFKNGGLK